MKTKFVSLLITIIFLLSACAPTATPVPTATEKPVVTEPATEVPTEAAVDECLACHTDKQRLIDTARPIVTAESESKGVG